MTPQTPKQLLLLEAAVVDNDASTSEDVTGRLCTEVNHHVALLP